jgi:hypothetical protein
MILKNYKKLGYNILIIIEKKIKIFELRKQSNFVEHSHIPQNCQN